MERQQAKPKNKNSNRKFMKFLPKAVSEVAFVRNAQPFSPGRDHQTAVSIVPVEARVRRQKDDSVLDEEPTSPKVSCIGQIKLGNNNNNNKKKKNKFSKAKATAKKPETGEKKTHESKTKRPEKGEEKHLSRIKRMFTWEGKSARAVGEEENEVAPAPSPSLGQMRRFSSQRGVLASFDWTAEITPVDDQVRHDREYYSDGERGEEEEYEIGRENIIPFSAPMTLGDDGVVLKPKNEVNLWKRRTMEPPRPLQIKPR